MKQIGPRPAFKAGFSQFNQSPGPIRDRVLDLQSQRFQSGLDDCLPGVKFAVIYDTPLISYRVLR
jgi:hypothetical protein